MARQKSSRRALGQTTLPQELLAEGQRMARAGRLCYNSRQLPLPTIYLDMDEIPKECRRTSHLRPYSTHVKASARARAGTACRCETGYRTCNASASRVAGKPLAWPRPPPSSAVFHRAHRASPAQGRGSEAWCSARTSRPGFRIPDVSPSWKQRCLRTVESFRPADGAVSEWIYRLAGSRIRIRAGPYLPARKARRKSSTQASARKCSREKNAPDCKGTGPSNRF